MNRDRKIQSPHLAIERAASMLKPYGVSVQKARRGYDLQYNGDSLTHHSTIKTLARLAELAERLGVNIEAVRWDGTVPIRGLAAWEERALLRLKLIQPPERT